MKVKIGDIVDWKKRGWDLGHEAEVTGISHHLGEELTEIEWDRVGDDIIFSLNDCNWAYGSQIKRIEE